METKEGGIAVFKNTYKKEGDKMPDMRGQAKCVCPHCQTVTEYDVAMWSQVTKTGNRFLAGQIKVPNQNYASVQIRSENDKAGKTEFEKTAEEKSKDLPF